MRRSLPFVAALLWFALPAAGLAQTQERHVVPPETLEAMAAAHAASLDADRAELRAFLERPEVREIAAEAGLDVVTAETAVAFLGPDEVRDLAARIDQVDAALVGGDTVVISTTAIIIGLLVLIIILVA